MKRIFKNNIKILIGIIIGIIISGTIVYASGILASQINYNNTTVDQALNSLYTTVTTYKNLTTETTAVNTDIAEGKTAYDNLGNLITGIAQVSGGSNCVFDSFVCNTDCTNQTGYPIVEYVPDYIVVYGLAQDFDSGYWWQNVYNRNVDTQKYTYMSERGAGGVSTIGVEDFKISDNKFLIFGQNGQLNKRYYYMACTNN